RISPSTDLTGKPGGSGSPWSSARPWDALKLRVVIALLSGSGGSERAGERGIFGGNSAGGERVLATARPLAVHLPLGVVGQGLGDDLAAFSHLLVVAPSRRRRARVTAGEILPPPRSRLNRRS